VRVVAEHGEAAGQRSVIVFRLRRAEFDDGLLEDLFDILGRSLGQAIHHRAAAP